MSTDKLLQETHDAVIAIETRMDVWCPRVDGRLKSLERTVDGNGRDGLKATVGWHRKLFIVMGIVALAVGGLVVEAIHKAIH